MASKQPIPEPEAIDIEEIVRKWAWENYDETASKRQKKLRKKHDKLLKKGQQCLDLVIDWSEVKFVDVTHWPKFAEADEVKKEVTDLDNQQNSTHEANRTLTAKGDASTDLDKQEHIKGIYKPEVNILFRTTFTNNTAHEQKYTLRTEKTTRSACEVTIEQGYTKGMEFSVTLKTPGEIMEANAGFSTELSLNKTEGQTIEEEVTWGVESEITVEMGHCADATLVVLERKYDDLFEIESRLAGNICVRFTNMLDNNSSVKFSQRGIDNIMKDFLGNRRKMNKPVSEKFVKIEGRTVFIYTKGKCNFRYGIKQDVRVDQRKLQITQVHQ